MEMQRKILRGIALAAALLALLGLFMLVLDVGFFGNFTGLELVEEAWEDLGRRGNSDENLDFCMVAAAALAVIAVIVYFLALRKNKMPAMGILCSVVAMLLLYIAISEDRDYLGFGFYLFELASAVAAICGVLSHEKV